MKPNSASLFDKQSPQLSGRFRYSSWAAILSAILVCLIITGLHFRQQQILHQTIDSINSMHQARIELSQGFLYIVLADSADTPFSREEGLALLNQAVTSLEESANSLEAAVRGYDLNYFNTSLDVFKTDLLAFKTNGSPTAGQLTNLRIAFHNLDYQAGVMDEQSLVVMQTLSDRFNREFVAMLLGSTGLLLAISFLVLSAGLAREKAELDRSKAQQEADIALAKYSTLFGIFPMGIVVTDPQGHAVEMNQVAKDLFGSFIGKKPWEHVLTAGKDIIQLNGKPFPVKDLPCYRSLRTGKKVSNVVMGIQTGDRTSWVNVTAAPLSLKEFGVVVTYADISERIRFELGLGESEARSRAMIHAIPDLMFRMDRSGIFMDYKADVKELHEQSVPLVGRNIREVTPPGFAALVKEKIEETLVSGQTQTFEYQLLVPGTGQQEFEARMAPSGGDEVIAIVRNITTSKRVAEEKRKNEALLSEAQRIGRIGHWEWNAPDDDLICSDELFEILGLKHKGSALPRAKLVGLIHPEDKGLIHQSDLRAFDTHSDLNYQFRVKVGSRWRWLHQQAGVEYDPEGNPKRILGVLQDITERKETEERLRQSEKKYRHLTQDLERRVDQRTAEITVVRERLELAVQAASLGIWEWDLHSNQLRWDDQMFQIYRTSPDGFSGNIESFMKLLHPDDVEKITSVIQQLVDGSITLGEIEFRILRGDGSPGCVKTHGIAQRDADNQILRVIGVVQDVTRERMAEQTLRENETQLRRNRDELALVNVSLEKAARAKDEFLANMSHELRTPLTGILGMSEILFEGVHGKLNLDQNRMVSMIRSSGEHLLSLINDILDLSKIEAAKFELSMDLVSIEDICKSSLNFIRETAAKKEISVGYDRPDRKASMQADPLRLKQILVNLLSNAVKFTPQGGRVTLKVNLDEERKQVHFSVRDNGIGIASEDLKRLFTPFTQVDNSLTRQYQGTGLGLVLVKRLTEMHGGSLQVESEPGQGSCFTVSIPWRGDRGEDEKMIANETVIAQGHQDTLVLGSILMVEDNETNIMTIGDYLEHKGYQLLVARTGREALEKVLADKPDLILMDLQLPEMSGLEVIRRLREMPSQSETPIIALTALAMEGDRERCLKAGATSYISKPVQLKSLVTEISILMKKG